MAVTPFDSAIYRGLFHDDEVGKLFTDSAELRAMLLVEGALAKAQGALGIIPAQSAAFIHRASLELQLDPGGLAAETARSAVVVPALVAAFRKAMDAPEHAQYVHWGATSQDIIDTALVLRLRQMLRIYDARLVALIRALGHLAAAHAHLPMAARTWGQIATPTSFGAVVASWGMPLLRHRLRLLELRPRLLRVSLAGAAGTLSVMGEQAPLLREKLAAELGLEAAHDSWHSARDTIGELAGWITLLLGSLGKIGVDVQALAQSGIGEVALPEGGGSSTMPQKSNPVQPALLEVLARHTNALNTEMQGAMVHRGQRDGAAWMAEWLSLPQMCMSGARALAVADDLSALAPIPAAMAANLAADAGSAQAEALTFALARLMPRPEAQEAVKSFCLQAKSEGARLSDLVRARWPNRDFSAVFSPEAQLGEAPAQALDFARRAETI